MQRFDCPLPNLIPERGVMSPQEAELALELNDISHATNAWIADRKVACEAECAAARAEAVADGLREGMEAFVAAAETHRAARAALGEELVQLIASCLSEVIGQCPKRDILKACIRSVLDSGYEDGDLVIQVAAEDFDDMSSAVADLTGANTPTLKISVELSDTVEKGRSVFYAPSDVLTVDQEIFSAQLLTALNSRKVLGPLQARLAAFDDIEACA